MTLPNPFSDSGSSEKTDFSSPNHRRQKINCFDSCFQNFIVFNNLTIIKTFGINRLFTFFLNGTQSINWLSKNVQATSQNTLTCRNHNWLFRIDNLKTAV